ncbi:MAG: hypothetical protein WCF33_07905 [Pseudonocardiaceae bacterium]
MTIFRQLRPDLAATRGFGRGRDRLVGLGAGWVPIPCTNGYGAALRLLLRRDDLPALTTRLCPGLSRRQQWPSSSPQLKD